MADELKREDFTKRKFTQVDDSIWVCNDCGAHAGSPRDIKHYDSCKPGECEYWKEFYSRADEDMDEPDGDGPDNCIEPFTGFIGE